MTTATFSPGSLVRARGREWIVLTGSSPEVLKVRPLSGSEEDATAIHLRLETSPVTEATFPPPTPKQKAGHDSAQLLRDALVLSMRRGAGPFRSFGQISVEPRAYQLVPLLMALKLDTVRLLVADDVGIGKTIEAALIAREFLDRGDIDRFAVLCPPHLVEQWVSELEHRFHLRAVAVTAASATRLERGLPQTESIFTQYPFTVVSLDYIKSERRRADFVRACPGFVIVDEAHTCASADQRRHQRYDLLKDLAADTERHMVFLTATPHSGDDEAFYRLLGLLDPAFEGLAGATERERKQLREKLAHHFVQRRRPDIREWKEERVFPDRQTAELTYTLTGEWERFFEAVLDYCATIVASAGGDEKRQRLNFWGTLALMRCVASSPRAALKALRTRAGLVDDQEVDDEELQARLFDGAADSLPDDDVEPPAGVGDQGLEALMKQASKLAGQAGDPKLKLLSDHLEELFEKGHAPVVFCRYIATAEYLGDHLRKRFPKVTVAVVTGDFTSDERKRAVEELGEADQRLLVATDCLSEGINLQDGFDAVVHYDLSWNPMRHEQREGRVDRFGQEKEIVRATLLYGANNPVDGAVLGVILRKADRIRKELGVPVPLPDNDHALTQALMKAVLLRHRGETRQREMFDETVEGRRLETAWESAKEKAKANRTIFAQRSMSPDEVLPEFHRTRAAIGSADDVKRFTDRTLTRLGAGPEPLKRGARVSLGSLPDDVQARLEAEGLSGTLRIDFKYPAAPGCRPVQRSHPLVSVLADTLLERTLASAGDEPTPVPGVLGRLGCWITPAVTERTVVTLLRLRHQLVTTKTKRTTTLLVEECSSFAWSGAASATREDLDAFSLLATAPSGDPPAHVRERFVTEALSELAARGAELASFAQRRATHLLDDHRRVREAAAARGSYSVKALLPVDVIALFVLLPKVS